MTKSMKAALRPVRNLAITIIVNIMGSALLFYFLERATQLRERDLKLDASGCLYWAVTTASTTGYGDISPITDPGRYLGMWLMITSVGLVAIATGQLAGAVANDPHLFSKDAQAEVADDLDDTIGMLCLLLEHHNIPIPAGVEEYHNKKGSANE